MRERRFGAVYAPDTALDELSVSLRSRRYLGDVRKLIRKMLDKHYLAASAVVTEL